MIQLSFPAQLLCSCNCTCIINPSPIVNRCALHSFSNIHDERTIEGTRVDATQKT